VTMLLLLVNAVCTESPHNVVEPECEGHHGWLFCACSGKHAVRTGGFGWDPGATGTSLPC
jgi:hypothetical protein